MRSIALLIPLAALAACAESATEPDPIAVETARARAPVIAAFVQSGFIGPIHHPASGGNPEYWQCGLQLQVQATGLGNGSFLLEVSMRQGDNSTIGRQFLYEGRALDQGTAREELVLSWYSRADAPATVSQADAVLYKKRGRDYVVIDTKRITPASPWECTPV